MGRKIKLIRKNGRFQFIFRFKWTFEKYYPYFTITPEHGFVSPGNSAVFTIQFKPPTLGTLFEAKVIINERYRKCYTRGFRSNALSVDTKNIWRSNCQDRA